jgi:hypothetical protein
MAWVRETDVTGSHRSGRYDPERFPESDWKHLRAVHAVALERYCARVIQECRRVCGETDLTAHERYLRVFGLFQERDKELASAFDDLRRSRAALMLATLIRLDVVTAEELEKFSQGVREAAVSLASGLAEG